MPQRVNAKPPGEFIRDHLVATGGTDYIQSIYRAYTDHLKELELRSRASRASFSKYIWVANQLGLIVFDYAATQSRWGGQEDGAEPKKGYKREPRPQAPSPRHYYRLVDAQDPRWLDMDRAYREMQGLPVPPPRPPREKKPKPEKPRAAPARPAAKPKPTKKKPAAKPTAAAEIRSYVVRIKEISGQLDRLSKKPTPDAFRAIDQQLMTLGEEVVLEFEKSRAGRRREQLSLLNYNLMHALEKLDLIKGALNTMESDPLPARREQARAAIPPGVRAIKEDLLGGLDNI